LAHSIDNKQENTLMIDARRVEHRILVIGGILALLRYLAFEVYGYTLETFPIPQLYGAVSGIMFGTGLLLILDKNREPRDFLLFTLATLGLICDALYPPSQGLIASTAYLVFCGLNAFIALMTTPQRKPDPLYWSFPLVWLTLLLFGSLYSIFRLQEVYYFGVPTSISLHSFFITTLIMLVGALGLAIIGGRRSSFKLTISALALLGVIIDFFVPSAPIAMYASTALYFVAGGLSVFRMMLVAKGVKLE
jgi:hypothetical protein